MPRAKTPRAVKPKAEKAAKKVAGVPEVAAGGNGNGHGNQHHVDLDSEIRLRAYELYQRRGSSAGQADDDWLQAEREVMERRG